MTGKRTRYSADFKAKVALEALRGELTTAQLAVKHSIHQTMVGEWKRQAMEGLTAVFSGKAAAPESAKAAEAEVEKLHAKIGQLVVERALLHKWPEGDSSRESSVIAGRHEQTDTADLQDQELACLQRRAQATRLANDLARSRDDLGSRADR